MKNKFMASALKCAKKAYEEGEVPIGAVVVCDGKIIGRGHNRRTKRQIATAHAEIAGACLTVKFTSLLNPAPCAWAQFSTPE